MASEAAHERRHTLCGDAAAEARVAQDLSRLATGIDSEVGEVLRALLLVGRFARGEGGIVRVDGEPCAADPGYELLAVFTHGAQRHLRALRTIGATWSRLLRARVSIHPVSSRDLPGAPASRFWFHVGHGQAVTLSGSPNVIAAVPKRRAEALRWEEANFALCPALLELALHALEAPADLPRGASCMHAAALALGDALLLRRGQYELTLHARARALELAHAGAALRAAYRDAIRWSGAPDAWAPEHLTTASWLESTRQRLLEAHLLHAADRRGAQRDLLSYATAARALHANPEAPERGRLGRAARRLASERPELAGLLLPPFERLLRSVTLLGFGARSPACRDFAAKLLHAGKSDAELATGLRALARHALPDELS